jgi:hypothetical protein
MAATSHFCFLCIETIDHPIYMPCGQHCYCDGCFCLVLERAIALEENYPVPCGSTGCHHSSLQEIDALLTSYPKVQAGQRDDLLTRYAGRLPEYNTQILDRTYCSNPGCILTQGSSRLLDSNTCSIGASSRLRCPDCNTATCVNCNGPWNGPNHTCILAARDAENYIASLPEEKKWQWLKCGGCNTWVGKKDLESCNHITCRYGRLSRLSRCS